MEPPGAVFEAAAADFAARSLFSDVALGGLFPAAEIAHEVDGRDDGVSLLLGDRAAYVPLLAVWRSLGDAAVRPSATAVLERAAEGSDEGPELGDAAAVLVACHEAMVTAIVDARRESASGRAMSNIGHGERWEEQAIIRCASLSARARRDTPRLFEREPRGGT